MWIFYIGFNLTKIRFKGSGTSTPIDRFSYEYDQSGNIAVYHTHDDNGDIIKSEYYTYNSSGNLIQSVDQDGNKVLYSYNESGKLTGLSFQTNNKEFDTQYLHNECITNGTEPCSISVLYDKTSFSIIGETNVTKDYVYETNALRRLDFIRLSIGTYAIKQDFTFSGNTTRISNITYDIGENGTTE